MNGGPGKILRGNGYLQRSATRLRVMIRQQHIEREPRDSRIRKIGQFGHDTRPVDSNLSRRAEIHRLPDPHIAVADFRDPIPTYRAEHGHILADVAGGSSIFIKIAKSLSCGVAGSPGTSSG